MIKIYNKGRFRNNGSKYKDKIYCKRNYVHKKQRNVMNRPNGKAVGQEGGLLNILSPLMKACLRLMKNVVTPLTKNVCGH